jgi:hypothetical protein
MKIINLSLVVLQILGFTVQMRSHSTIYIEREKEERPLWTGYVGRMENKGCIQHFGEMTSLNMGTYKVKKEMKK